MRLVLLLITLVVLAAIGCGGGDDASGRVETDAPQIPLSGDATQTGQSGTPANTAAATVKMRRIGSFESPTYLAAPPRDRHRLFVVEQAGTIREVRDGKKVAKPFLDIRSHVQSGGERGLLSMAFAPDYAKSKRFYVYYTGGDGDIHIQEFPSRRQLVRIEHSTYPNHNGGQLEVGPDGRAYARPGGGGGGGGAVPHA